jgi:hypothetical protein
MKVPRAGFEPATTRSSAGRSPRLSYLGFSIQKKCLFAFKFSELLLKKVWDASFLALSKEKGEKGEIL